MGKHLPDYYNLEWVKGDMLCAQQVECQIIQERIEIWEEEGFSPEEILAKVKEFAKNRREEHHQAFKQLDLS